MKLPYFTAVLLTAAFVFNHDPIPAMAQTAAKNEARTAGRVVNPEMSKAHKRYWGVETTPFTRGGPVLEQEHPARWDGIVWDPEKWEGSGWTADRVINNLFHYGAFKRLSIYGETPILRVGKKFFELSELDQRRSLDLLAKDTHIFEKGYTSFKVIADEDGRDIGTYRATGLTRY